MSRHRILAIITALPLALTACVSNNQIHVRKYRCAHRHGMMLSGWIHAYRGRRSSR